MKNQIAIVKSSLTQFLILVKNFRKSGVQILPAKKFQKLKSFLNPFIASFRLKLIDLRGF